jgi:hypothetical protein
MIVVTISVEDHDLAVFGQSQYARQVMRRLSVQRRFEANFQRCRGVDPVGSHAFRWQRVSMTMESRPIRAGLL